MLFPPSLPFKPPPGRSWGTTKSAGEGIRRTRARVRACAAGRMYAQLHHCAAGARQGRGFAAGPRGPFCRSVGKCRVRRCEAAGSGSAERRARCRSAGWPFGTLRLLGVGAGAHPESLARWPRRLIRGVETIGVENRLGRGDGTARPCTRTRARDEPNRPAQHALRPAVGFDAHADSELLLVSQDSQALTALRCGSESPPRAPRLDQCQADRK